MKTTILISFAIGLFSFTCKNENPLKPQIALQPLSKIEIDTVKPAVPVLPPYREFDRQKILERLEGKIRDKKPLVVHVFVPLCDNDNQGIVPVSNSLGDGTNLRTNLYWGARYGVKSFFRIRKDWRLLKSELFEENEVMERVVFKKTYPNQAQVFLVADAYRGDQMQKCLVDYFHSLAELKLDTVQLENGEFILANGHADLLCFNGHNGFMDTDIDPVVKKSREEKDAVAIACVSDVFFREPLNYVKAYPLVTTSSLLAPEAYVLANVIDSWANLEDEAEVRLNAARAYNEYQKCGLKGARGIFISRREN